MQNIRLYFNDLGFDVEPISDTIFLAQKKGRHFMFLKFTDYYFVRHDENLSAEKIKDCHETSKIIANKDFKLPKSLRLTVPNINTVFITESNITEEVASFVKKRSFDFIGGQQDSIFLIDRLSSKMYCAGREYSHISGEAKLIWGNSKDFKKINGHNRSYQLMTNLFNSLYK
ncbi:hypothetical protein [Winogradskyella flava]|uniref:hypothetical protein n=1 Tax=Winogradskyella flava TaxID=1884876 RepID=UPI00248F580A|nr:hypothetical protein [Winogradskyella flava]